MNAVTEQTEPGAVYFCRETGVRIAGPGVCRAVDSENGKNEVREGVPAPESARAAGKTGPMGSTGATVATDTEGASDTNRKRR